MAIFFSVERVTGRIIKKRKKYEGYRMAYKKGRGFRKKKRLVKRAGEVFVSPDGGETVYIQNIDGTRGRLVSQSQSAKDLETVESEYEMTDEYAVKMRRKYPALGKAWKHYKTVWRLIMSEQ